MTDQPGEPEGPPRDRPADIPPPPTPAGPTARPYDRWAHRRGEPRVFAFLWTVFLFAATAATFVSAFASGSASPEVMRPATRALIAVTLAGIAVLWPMVRLSQTPDRHPVAGVAQDLIVVLIPAQAVIWPQWFGWLGRWPVSVIGAASVLCCAWAFLVGSLLANAQVSHFAAAVRAGAAPSRGWRPGRWMIAFVVLTLAGMAPALLRLTPAPPGPDPRQEAFRGTWMLSPITAVYELTRDRVWTGVSAAVVGQHWTALGLTGLCAVPLWLIAVIRARGIRPNRGLH